MRDSDRLSRHGLLESRLQPIPHDGAAAASTLEVVYEYGVFRPLTVPDLTLSDGQRVPIVVEPVETADDVLAFATAVYEGLSQKKIAEIERIALLGRDPSPQRCV